MMDNYERIKVVGRGAFGTVYLCRRHNDKKLVIIKQIPVETMTKEERQAALNEVKVLSMLHHPNIIEYYENFLEDKALMIVMEYAQGGTLFDYLQERGNALLEEDEVLRLFTQILLSLQHVHSKQILHRDLKTQNILMNLARDVVKTGDFGISKILSSKSKAVTVVGTPCYISPELCEGKPYNQKSDIWAAGCILYELLTLKRAFEANTLAALIMKIMRGSIAPISDRYSDSIKKLLLNMLQQDPNKRPTTNQVMAEPIIMKTLVKVVFDMGRVKGPSRFLRAVSSHSASSVSQQNSNKPSRTKTASLKGSVSSVFLHSSNNSGMLQSHPASIVYYWGTGSMLPVCLPMPNNDIQITSVAVGRMQKVGVAHTGRLILWESSSVSSESIIPGSLDTPLETFVPRFLEGQSAVTILQVACGDLFTACLTDRGILMTFGNGAHGCLGHGTYHDVAQAKIIEALLGYEVTQVSCGASHVMIVTNENEVFAWGRGDNGRLGLGNNESYSIPQTVALPANNLPSKVECGQDCSVLLTTHQTLLACGNNRYNKLGLDKSSSSDTHSLQISESMHFAPVATEPLSIELISSFALGTSHSAFLTDSSECWLLGSNQFGQLGCITTLSTSRIPVQPNVPNCKFSSVACGDTFTVAVSLEDGTVLSWGKGSRGRLGRHASNPDVPGEVQLKTEVPYTVTGLSCSHGNTLLATKSHYDN